MFHTFAKDVAETISIPGLHVHPEIRGSQKELEQLRKHFENQQSEIALEQLKLIESIQNKKISQNASWKLN
jgi:ATP phosphoribosyltransferase regulatory subunit HisZ